MAAAVERRTFSSLPVDLLRLVALELDERCLASFAVACTVCHTAAHSELRSALLAAVKRCLAGAGPIGNALVACPYFRLPDDLVVSRLSGRRGSLPASAFHGCTALTSLALVGNHAALSTIGMPICGLNYRPWKPRN